VLAVSGRNCYRMVLASASPRRLKIARACGLDVAVAAQHTDEVMYEEDPRRTAVENARRKHDACRSSIPDACILAADTVIELDGRCVAKPVSMEDAIRQLLAFSGRSHTVITGVAFSAPGGGLHERICESTVVFRAVDRAAAMEYFNRVHPLDKSGSYDIDQHPEMIIDSFTGSRTNVMGLPRSVVREWASLK